MNLPVSRTLLPLAFLFLLFACDDPSEINLQLDGQGNTVGTHYKDDLAVEATTVLLQDSIVGFGVRPALVGRVDKIYGSQTENPFGVITARTFTQLSLRSTNLSFGANTGVADKVELSLAYAYSYGDTTKAITLNVYELAEAFDEKRTYYTSSTMAKGPLLGTVTFVPRPSGKRTSIETGDTPLTNPIVFELDKELGSRFLKLEGTPSLTNQDEFAKYFKGLIIEPAEGSVGSVLGIDLQAENSKVTIFYTGEGAAKTSIFPFLGVDPRFNQITADRTGTSLEALQKTGDALPASATGNVTFLQSGTGLRTKITLPDLESLKTLGSNIAINRAELVVPVQRGPNDPAVTPNLYLYETDQTNRILRAPDGTTPRRVQIDGGANLNRYDAPAQFMYNSQQQTLTIPLTSYLQAMLNGTKPNNGLLISSGSNSNLVNGTILKASATERIRLRVYYSVLD